MQIVSAIDDNEALTFVPLSAGDWSLITGLWSPSGFSNLLEGQLHKNLELITDLNLQAAVRAHIIERVAYEVDSPFQRQIVAKLSEVETQDPSPWLQELAKDAREFLSTFYGKYGDQELLGKHLAECTLPWAERLASRIIETVAPQEVTPVLLQGADALLSRIPPEASEYPQWYGEFADFISKARQA